MFANVTTAAGHAPATDHAAPRADVVTRLLAGTDTGATGAASQGIVAPCFTPGALIATMRGEVPVEHLKAGDKVLTRDNGLQEIRWVGAQTVLPTGTDLRPVLIRAGALGNGCPQRDILVSPQHRMLITSDIAMMLFDEREVLVAAKHLLGLTGIEQIDVRAVTYVHILFDHHEIILADGAWTESFQPNDHSLRGIGADQRAEIVAVFPGLAQPGSGRKAARCTLTSAEARVVFG